MDQMYTMFTVYTLLLLLLLMPASHPSTPPTPQGGRGEYQWGGGMGLTALCIYTYIYIFIYQSQGAVRAQPTTVQGCPGPAHKGPGVPTRAHGGTTRPQLIRAQVGPQMPRVAHKALGVRTRAQQRTAHKLHKAEVGWSDGWKL